MLFICTHVCLVEHRYLKYYCNNSMSWGGETEGDYINIPDPLPVVEKTWKQKVWEQCNCEVDA